MSLLANVITGKIVKPHFVLLYGEPGIGKSSWAAAAPSPIFLCSEDGADELGVARIKLTSLSDLRAILNELLTSAHEYKSIVIDTVDHFEQLIFAEVAKDKGKKTIEDIGFAKGYIYALDYWFEITGLLERARNEKKMNIVLLAHSIIKAHNDPQLDAPYDTYLIKLHQKAAEFLRDRVSCVLFATYKTYLHEKESQKTKAYGDGSRVVYTEKRPAFIAKNRFNLPFEIPLNFDDFDLACKAQKPKDLASLVSFIEANLSALEPGIREKATLHFKANIANPAVLAQIEDRIKTIISTKTA